MAPGEVPDAVHLLYAVLDVWGGGGRLHDTLTVTPSENIFQSGLQLESAT